MSVFNRPNPDVSFSKADIESFASSPVWHAIKDLWLQQRELAIESILKSRGDDDEYLKGLIDQINYNLNLENILLEEKHG